MTFQSMKDSLRTKRPLVANSWDLKTLSLSTAVFGRSTAW